MSMNCFAALFLLSSNLSSPNRPRAGRMALPRFGLDVTFCFQQSSQDASGYAVSIGGVRLLAFFCDKCLDTGFKLNAFLVFVPLHTAKPQLARSRDSCSYGGGRGHEGEIQL